jgi:ubiquitin-activating enzyme E1
MPLSLVELVSVVGKVVLSTTESKITFSISCTDANDEDVEVPDVVARVR